MTGHTPWRDIKHKRFSSDVGDEHVERESQFPRPEMQEIGKPPTQPPPKPADARRSVEPPAYRYKPNLERSRSTNDLRLKRVRERDREIVEGMLRHTKPIVEQIRDPLTEKIVFPSGSYEPDKVDHLYPYQTEAVEQIEEAVDLLNGIIQTQAQKLREYEEALVTCRVDLHNSKQHELGLMCGELQEKLNKIAKIVDENEHIGLASFITADIREILEG